ncbi:DUF6612 family protein [Paenibacillus ginsengarvi]|uniref:LppX_LprAFG lipoprotein n=1 Tax=Paenibacillus ginsengarvi TaxID=400777 RepID=A0A3B0CJ07_9BACL|nr:DUF6612 family protein [Paenibacillus ginsengarvi]RKN84287.1 hypothetical protein D7M11_14920 [Paenibacillus ginsengarvi]
MKKRNKWLQTGAVAVLAASLLVLAACGQKPEGSGAAPVSSPVGTETAVKAPETAKPADQPKKANASDVIQKTMEAASKLDSFTTNMNMKQTMEQAGNKTDMQSVIAMDVVMKPQMSFKQTMSMNMLGQDIKMESYMTKDGFFMKEPTTGQWMKLPKEQSDLMLSAVSSDQLDPSKQLEKLKPFLNDFVLTESGDDYTVKLTAGGDKFNEFIKNEMKSYMNSNPNMEKLLEQNMSAIKITSVDYTFTVDKKTQYPKSMKVNMDLEMDIQGQKMRLVQNIDGTYSNHNGIKEIALPKEALEAKAVGAAN